MSRNDSVAASPSGLVEAEGDKPKVAPTRRYFSELRASLKNALDVTSDLEQVGAGEGSRPSLPVAPDSPLDFDPLEAAITVLSHDAVEYDAVRDALVALLDAVEDYGLDAAFGDEKFKAVVAAREAVRRAT